MEKAARFERILTRAGCDHHMETRATVAAFARPVRLRPVDRRSTPCPRASPIAPRTSSLAVQTQRRKLRRTRPERSDWPEPEPTSSGPWQPREPMLPDDGDFGPVWPASRKFPIAHQPNRHPEHPPDNPREVKSPIGRGAILIGR